MRKLANYFKTDKNDISKLLKDDLFYVGHSIIPECFESYTIDEFGVHRDTSDKGSEVGDWGDIIKFPLSEPSINNYKFPDGSDKRRFAHLDIDALKSQERFVILGMTGLFDICWHLRSFEEFMVDLAINEQFATMLLDNALQYSLDLVSIIPDCVDGVRVGEDWGMQTGLIMSAEMWRKYLKPRLKLLYEKIRKRGFRLFIHSCGNILEIFPDIIELGVEVVHPIQPEVMDITLLQREYGKYISMYGGIGTQSTLVFGTPEDVINESKAILKTFKDGGYIFGPAGAISTDTKFENVIALVDFAMSMKL